MPSNNYSLSDIVKRIMLVLPSKFSQEEDTNIFAILSGISAALKINTDMIDELYRQTNLVSASGAYVDGYISDLAGYGRKPGETDSEYKLRYYNNVFKYNCTKEGIESIVIDLFGEAPFAMFTKTKRGAFFDSRHYYDDSSLISTYGDPDPDAYEAYIQFAEKPFTGDPNQAEKLEELCKTIDAARASGIKIYLYYPQ